MLLFYCEIGGFLTSLAWKVHSVRWISRLYSSLELTIKIRRSLVFITDLLQDLTAHCICDLVPPNNLDKRTNLKTTFSPHLSSTSCYWMFFFSFDLFSSIGPCRCRSIGPCRCRMSLVMNVSWYEWYRLCWQFVPCSWYSFMLRISTNWEKPKPVL